jgi:hypothetical protein
MLAVVAFRYVVQFAQRQGAFMAGKKPSYEDLQDENEESMDENENLRSKIDEIQGVIDEDEEDEGN